MQCGRVLLYVTAALVPCTVGCRWALVASAPRKQSELLAAAELFLDPPHSLVHQSYTEPFVPYAHLSPRYDAVKHYVRNHKCNRDGWGIGWGDANGTVYAFKSAAPGTTKGKVSKELDMVVKMVTGRVVFGHMRAATEGENLEVNSHPYIFDGRLLWMHNGGVANIDHIRREVLPLLPDDIQRSVNGSTDSEVIGAIFTARVRHRRDLSQAERPPHPVDLLREAMIDTIALIDSPLALQRNATLPRVVGPYHPPCPAGSSLNFAASDGKHVVATRLRLCDSEDPPSLFLSLRAPRDRGFRRYPLQGCDFSSSKAVCPLVRLPISFVDHATAIAVSSEPLDKDGSTDWALLPKDSLLTFDGNTGEVRLQCVTQACLDDEAGITDWDVWVLPGFLQITVCAAVAAFVSFAVLRKRY